MGNMASGEETLKGTPKTVEEAYRNAILEGAREKNSST